LPCSCFFCWSSSCKTASGFPSATSELTDTCRSASRYSLPPCWEFSWWWFPGTGRIIQLRITAPRHQRLDATAAAPSQHPAV